MTPAPRPARSQRPLLAVAALLLVLLGAWLLFRPHGVALRGASEAQLQSLCERSETVVLTPGTLHAERAVLASDGWVLEGSAQAVAGARAVRWACRVSGPTLEQAQIQMVVR